MGISSLSAVASFTICVSEIDAGCNYRKSGPVEIPPGEPGKILPADTPLFAKTESAGIETERILHDKLANSWIQKYLFARVFQLSFFVSIT